MDELDQTELGMLRDFYEQWCKLHSIDNNPIRLRKKQMQAQRLVDAAEQLKAFYEPQSVQ